MLKKKPRGPSFLQIMLLLAIYTYMYTHVFISAPVHSTYIGKEDIADCLFGWFLNVLVNYQVISRTGPKTERLTILRAATHETELGDHDFYLSQSHYTDTDPTSRERAATGGIEPGTSSPGVTRSTD